MDVLTNLIVHIIEIISISVSNQVITLYTLNLHNVLCQLYLNKAWEKSLNMDNKKTVFMMNT